MIGVAGGQGTPFTSDQGAMPQPGQSSAIVQGQTQQQERGQQRTGHHASDPAEPFESKLVNGDEYTSHIEQFMQTVRLSGR